MRAPETRNAKLSCLNIQVSTTLASPRPPLEPLSIRRFHLQQDDNFSSTTVLRRGATQGKMSLVSGEKSNFNHILRILYVPIILL